MEKSKLEKDTESGSKTIGQFWLRLINLDGKYSNEMFTKQTVLELKKIASKDDYSGWQDLLEWFKKYRPAIFKSSITDGDPNGLMYELIDILKDFEV
jgi:hypothetical protein